MVGHLYGHPQCGHDGLSDNLGVDQRMLIVVNTLWRRQTTCTGLLVLRHELLLQKPIVEVRPGCLFPGQIFNTGFSSLLFNRPDRTAA